MNHEVIEFNNGLPLMVRVHSISKSPIHWHDGITEIILPIAGSVKIKANFEDVTLEEGEFFFINNQTIHSISSDKEAIVLLFYINLDYFQEQFPYIKSMFFRNSLPKELLGENKNCPKVKEGFITYFRNTLIHIFMEVNNKSISNCTFDEITHKLVYQIIYKFNWLQLLQNEGDYISSLQLDRYHRIVEYIEENYTQRIYLDDIVSREFLCKTYFSNIWKDLTSHTFQERIDYVRVLKSEFLLFQNMTISEISQQCGFSDIKYYYKNFKRWYGCMPLEYKKKCNLYEIGEYKYVDLDFYQVTPHFNNYSKKFYSLNKVSDEAEDFSNLLDNYFYLKYYHTANNKNPSTNTRYLLLDPFKYASFDEVKDNVIINWTAFDLLMNLVIDFKITLQIKLYNNCFDRYLIRDYSEKFLDKVSIRYGSEVLKNFQFLVDYRDSLNLQDDLTVESVITKKTGTSSNIKYYLEI